MGKSVNRVFLLGNVGKDPEIRATGGGTMVATFSLATSERQKDGQGNWQDRAEWHNIVAFARTAEIVRDYVRKGAKIHIEGRLQTQSWDDKNSGEKKYRTVIIVNDLSLLGGNGENNGANSGYGKSNGAASQNSGTSRNTRGDANEDWSSAEISDDDIPF